MTEETHLSAVQQCIVQTLGYFDYFRYPLSKDQLYVFLTVSIKEEEAFNNALDTLLDAKKIQSYKGYYALLQVESYVDQRAEGERRFALMQERINKTAKRLRYFPFIKFAGLSGSLSKGYAPVSADIDLFIITQKNRLWICRSILHLMKKISFLKGSQHWYCMNYFIDETAFCIEEQNYFTAIELSTLKPILDESDYYDRLMESNATWIRKELPNLKKREQVALQEMRNAFWNKFAGMLSNDRINLWLMQWTDGKWRAKWKKKCYPSEEYDLAFKTRINISKNHLHNYQKKMLQHLSEMNHKVK